MTDEMWMIRPEPRSIMWRAAAWLARKTPLRFASRIASHRSSLSSMKELNLAIPDRPALLTRMSRAPLHSSAAWIIAST